MTSFAIVFLIAVLLFYSVRMFLAGNTESSGGRTLLLAIVSGLMVASFYAFVAVTAPQSHDLISSTAAGIYSIVQPDPRDQWADWIKDYQTLIGGFIAIAAAVLTVLQMQASDIRSDQRHRDLIRLSMRGDLMKLRRAIAVLRKELFDDVKELDQFIAGYKAQKSTAGWETAFVESQEIIHYFEIIKRLRSVIVGQALENIRPMMDDACEIDLHAITVSLKELDGCWTDVRSIYEDPHRSLSAERYPHHATEILDEDVHFQCQVEAFAKSCRDLVQHAGELEDYHKRAAYEVEPAPMPRAARKGAAEPSALPKSP